MPVYSATRGGTPYSSANAFAQALAGQIAGERRGARQRAERLMLKEQIESARARAFMEQDTAREQIRSRERIARQQIQAQKRAYGRSERLSVMKSAADAAASMRKTTAQAYESQKDRAVRLAIAQGGITSREYIAGQGRELTEREGAAGRAQGRFLNESQINAARQAAGLAARGRADAATTKYERGLTTSATQFERDKQLRGIPRPEHPDVAKNKRDLYRLMLKRAMGLMGATNPRTGEKWEPEDRAAAYRELVDEMWIAFPPKPKTPSSPGVM